MERWLYEDISVRFQGRMLPVDYDVSMTWATISVNARLAGQSLPFVDSLIAATALAHGLAVVTRNVGDFERAGVRVMNPWSGRIRRRVSLSGVKRDPRLVRLSWDHHHGLVMARRISRELPAADDTGVAQLYSDLLRFWAAGLLPHFRVEGECLLARLVRHVPHSDESIERTNRDHLDLEAMVATMRDTEDPGRRRDALAAFGQRLQDHIRWEERVLFEVTQERFSEDELAALADDIEDQLPPLEPAPG